MVIAGPDPPQPACVCGSGGAYDKLCCAAESKTEEQNHRQERGSRQVHAVVQMLKMSWRRCCKRHFVEAAPLLFFF